MTALPNEPDPVDWGLSSQVEAAMEKVMASTEPPNIRWMTGELGHKLLAAFSACHTSLFMQAMREGLSKEEAQQAVAFQVPLLAFDLGRRIGADMAGAQAMREMFGGEDPFSGLGDLG